MSNEVYGFKENRSLVEVCPKSNTVDITGEQTITGKKTFDEADVDKLKSSTFQIKNTSISASDEDVNLELPDTSGKIVNTNHKFDKVQIVNPESGTVATIKSTIVGENVEITLPAGGGKLMTKEEVTGLYHHYVRLCERSATTIKYCYLNIFNNSSIEFNYSALYEYLKKMKNMYISGYGTSVKDEPNSAREFVQYNDLIMSVDIENSYVAIVSNQVDKISGNRWVFISLPAEVSSNVIVTDTVIPMYS